MQRCLALLISGVLLEGAATAAPVPKEAKVEIPPAPQPDETLFPLGSSGYGTVVAVSDTTVTLRPVANKWRTVEGPGGRLTKELLPVAEVQQLYRVHPVMRNGGIADHAYGQQGYRISDLKCGDLVDLYFVAGEKESRWLVAVSIHDRDKKGPPPPTRTAEDWDKIRIERQFARQQRLKAKAEVEKNDKK